MGPSDRSGECAGENMAALKAAGCTGDEIDSFCANSGKRPKNSNKWDEQVNCNQPSQATHACMHDARTITY